MIVKRVLLITLIIVLTQLSESFSQWALRKGEHGAIISFRYYESDQYYDADGILRSAVNDGKFQKAELGVWYSVGLGKKWGFFTGFSFAALQYKDKYLDNKSAGFTNPKIGIVYQITEYPKPVTGVLFSIDLPIHLPRNQLPELGAKFFEYDLSFAIGDGYKAFNKNGFWSFGVAGHYKANVFTEFQYRIFSAGGFDFSKKFTLFAGGEYSHSVNTSFRVLKVGGTLLYRVSKNVGLGVFTELIPYGRNIGIGPTGGLSLWYSYY